MIVESELEPSALGGRPTCYRCDRPKSMCVCSLIEPVDNRCRVTVLQHPRERHHPFGTVRFVRLGLRNSIVHVARRDRERRLHDPLPLAAKTGLIYPAPESLPLEETPPVDRPRQIIVIDGTWSQANCLFRDNPWLHVLPKYRLTAAGPSRYRIRRTPSVQYVSTLEAIIYALRLIEPETRGFDELLGSFDTMVERQIARGRIDRRPRFVHS